MQTFTIKQAEAIVGGLSETSKMPTMSISLPATLCKTGQKLRKVEGSVCSKCYACKGAYTWKATVDALQRRVDALGSSDWVDAWCHCWNKRNAFESLACSVGMIREIYRVSSTSAALPTLLDALRRSSTGYRRKRKAYCGNS